MNLREGKKLRRKFVLDTITFRQSKRLARLYADQEWKDYINPEMSRALRAMRFSPGYSRSAIALRAQWLYMLEARIATANWTKGIYIEWLKSEGFDPSKCRPAKWRTPELGHIDPERLKKKVDE